MTQSESTTSVKLMLIDTLIMFGKPWKKSGKCMFTQDHELRGKLLEHVCLHCLNQGKILASAETDHFISNGVLT